MCVGRKIVLFLSLLYEFSLANSATLGGNLEILPILSIPSDDSSSYRRNGLSQLRVNTAWTPLEQLEFNLAGRMVVYGGQDFHQGNAIASRLERDPGILDMRKAQSTEKIPTVVLGDVDRLNFVWNKEQFIITTGRQRINWGTNFVWNPNDWFNAYDYLEIAYPERPGSDGVRLQYYPGETTIFEVVAQTGEDSLNRTYATLFGFQALNYDWKVQAGLSGRDLATGYSWDGDIRGAGFSGELSIYKDIDSSFERKNWYSVASISLNYTFENSIFLQASTLYNGYPRGVVAPQLSKRLMEKKQAVFGEISYPWSPLIQVDLATIVSAEDASYCLIPLATFSLLENLDFRVSGQFFHGNAGDLFGNTQDIAYGSLKYSF